MFERQQAVRNANDELEFNRLVLEEDLDIDSQIEYRSEQKKRASDDPTEKRRLTKEISSLKDRKQQKEFTDEFSGKVSDYQQGLSSIDSLINYLQDQENSATDETILNTISEKLSEARTQKFNLTKQLLNDQTQYAVKDKSVSVIDTQLARVNTARTKALLSGDATLVATYDLQVQALNKAKNETSVSRDILSLGVVSSTGGATATALLDAYNAKIGNSANTGPLEIGGVAYNSPQDFWTFKRDQYVSDNSSNGFFPSLQGEIKNSMSLMNSKNSLSVSTVRDQAATFDMLKGRPELAKYTNQIDLYKQDALQTGTNTLTDRIANEFTRTLDLNKAVSDIAAIRNLGTNVDDAFTKLLSSGAAVKSTQVGNILDAARNAMANDPTLTPEAAIGKAVGAGAGAVLSPEQLATGSEKTIATDISKTGAAGAFPTDPRTTATPTTNVGTNIPTTSTPTTQGPATPPPVTPVTPPAYTINRQFDLGARDAQIKDLQRFLNASGFTVAASGDGSAGNETDYFGPLTQAALKKFQSAQGIVSTGDAATTGYGRLGPQTLAAISAFKPN